MTKQPAGWDGKWANGLDEAIDRLNQQHFEVKPTERNHMDARDRSAFKYICEQARAMQMVRQLPKILERLHNDEMKQADEVALAVKYCRDTGEPWFEVNAYSMAHNWSETLLFEKPEEALKSALEKNKDVK